MHRENVLIALTILITVLSLSFIILLSVFIQIYDVERRVQIQKKFLKEQEQIAKKEQEVAVGTASYFETMQKQQVSIKQQTEPQRINDPLELLNTVRWLENREDFNPEAGFGFLPQQPKQNSLDTVKFPFIFHENNGHLTLGSSKLDDNSSWVEDLNDPQVVFEVIKRIDDYLSRSFYRDDGKWKRRLSSPNRNLAPKQGELLLQKSTLQNIVNGLHKQTRLTRIDRDTSKFSQNAIDSGDFRGIIRSADSLKRNRQLI